MTDLDPREWGFPQGLEARLVRASELAADPADGRGAPLTPGERARLAAFGHADRRRQFALGRLSARTLAASRLGGEPAGVPLGVAADGAPTLPGAHVSIAHTGRGLGTAALAAVADRPVGVDLEAVGPRRPDLWRRILTAEERPLLEALGGPTDDAQTLLWCLKEAVLKGQRTGLRAGGRSVVLGLDAAGGAPHRGWARALSGVSGAWDVAFGREGALWVAVAWPAEGHRGPALTPGSG